MELRELNYNDLRLILKAAEEAKRWTLHTKAAIAIRTRLAFQQEEVLQTDTAYTIEVIENNTGEWTDIGGVYIVDKELSDRLILVDPFTTELFTFMKDGGDYGGDKYKIGPYKEITNYK